MGHTFVKKKPNLDGFWDPWGGHWEGLGWNVGQKKGKQKKHEKKEWKALGLDGHRGTGKEGFWEELGHERSNTPSPRGGAGGLFALRITRRGDLEACGFEARRLGE